MSTQKPDRLNDYLMHILDAIQRITNYTDRMTFEQFESDLRTQDAVIRNLEVIGEAARNILQRHPDFADQHPELHLLDAYEMRNVLAHGYFAIDLPIVWRTLRNDLPDMRQKIEKFSTP